jgi:hypothetical protein
MEEAPEPREIIWENVSLTQKTRVYLTATGWFLSIMVLIVLTVVFAFISKEKSILVEEEMGKYRH